MPPKLSILIPIYNEWKTIQELLDRVLELKFEKEILVIDDGSTDGTREILDRVQHPSIRIFRHPANRGKGAAIRTALANCTGDIVIIQDADLEQDPNDIYELVKPIMTGGAQVVYGSRFLHQRPQMHWSAYCANIFLSRLTSLLYAAKITDLETCYKVFSSPLIKSIPLQCTGFEFEPEVTAKLLKKGIKIYEVPIKEDWYHGYNNNSKKVTWWDGLKAVLTLLKYRFIPYKEEAALPQAESITLSKYYDERAAAFGKTIESCQYRSVKSFAQRQRAVLDLLKGTRGKRILDLGCGPGLFTSPLAEENEIVGLDLSLEMLRLARPDLKPVKGDGASLPFQSGSFDLVLAIEMLQHLADFKLLLEEILRVLRPGGELIISSLNPTSIFHRLLWSFGGYRGLFFHSDEKVESFLKSRSLICETRFLSFPFPWVWKGGPNKRWINFLATSWIIQCRLK